MLLSGNALATVAAMSQPRLIETARLFFRVGSTAFGGGDPTIAILQREFYRRGWLSPDQFAIAFGLARLTPGTNVLAFCAAAGWYLMGILGAITAVLGLTIPSSILVIWLTRAWELGMDYRVARAVISAMVAAAVGTMIGAAVMLVRQQCSKRTWLPPILIAAGAFVMFRFAGLSPLQVISIAAITGFFWVRP
jgi:chromate transporter